MRSQLVARFRGGLLVAHHLDPRMLVDIDAANVGDRHGASLGRLDLALTIVAIAHAVESERLGDGGGAGGDLVGAADLAVLVARPAAIAHPGPPGGVGAAHLVLL